MAQPAPTEAPPTHAAEHAAPADPSPGRACLPEIIQGGMGVAVSSWPLARAVSTAGQLGVVSGTALDVVLARRLQDGDTGGHLRRALAHFPVPEMAQRVLDRYLRVDGRPADRPYLPVPKLGLRPSAGALELAVVGGFAEVWLAKEGHAGPVGINFLEKVQMATPSVAYGAMLAGVDVVLVGAGIPVQIAGLLDRLATHAPVVLDIHVDEATRPHTLDFDPQALTGGGLPPLRRPLFLAIISAHILAVHLARTPQTAPDGFVVEAPAAGGHNAPPRGRLTLAEDGQPVFGPRDQADLAAVAAVGLPFWLGGGRGTPEQVRLAREVGASGVQVGSLFALAEESGIDPDLRRSMLADLAAGSLTVRTEARASPTGFPFKVVTMPGTQSQAEVYEARPRLCDVAHLRVPFERSSGTVGYRCPGEPVDAYLEKGGKVEATVGRTCLCNSLLATVGLGQTRRDGYRETALLTLGSDLSGAATMVERHPDGWRAADVLGYLLGRAEG